ncbi:recombinase family protein [Shewanella sp. 125m-1]
MNVPKIYSYSRVSTLEQKKGSGVEMQISEEVLNKLSTKYALPIATESFQDLGRSAFKGDHLKHELGIFLEAVKQGTVAKGSILVVYSLDRLSRLKIGYAKQIYYDLTNNGVGIYAMIDNCLYEAHNASHDIIATITFERAHNESMHKSNRTIQSAKEGLKKWRETSEPQKSLGRCPFWINQQTNSFNINAEGVKKAIELSLEGWGDLRIKKYLDEHFEHKRTRKSTLKTGASWSLSTINQIWNKRSLIGEKRFTIEKQEHTFKDYYPALIDVKTFYRLQLLKEKKSGRKTTSNKINFLKGLVRCNKCGGAMIFSDKSAKRKSYICNMAAKGDHQQEIFNAEMLEIITLEVCKDFYFESKVINDNSSESEIILNEHIKEAKNQLDDLTSRYKKKPRTSIADLIESQEDKIEELEKKLEHYSFNSFDMITRKLSQDLYTNEVRLDLNHPTRQEIHEILNRIIREIKVDRKEYPSTFSKIKIVQCIEITWIFKNGQTRKLKTKPFEYIDNIETKSLFIPFEYQFDIPTEEYRRSKSIITNVLEKLHSWGLLDKLYPSKGRYNWGSRQLNLGHVSSVTSFNLMEILKEQHEQKGSLYLGVETNSLEPKPDVFC